MVKQKQESWIGRRFSSARTVDFPWDLPPDKLWKCRNSFLRAGRTITRGGAKTVGSIPGSTNNQAPIQKIDFFQPDVSIEPSRIVFQGGKIFVDETCVDSGYGWGLFIRRWFAATFGSSYYFKNNTTSLQEWNGTSVVNAAITAPGAAASVAVGAAGALTGNYTYYTTYLNGEKESNPSPLSAVVSPSSQKIAVADIPVSADPQVTHKNLYRTAACGGGHYQLAKILNADTTYTDSLADTSLAYTAEVSFLNTPPDNGLKYITAHNACLVGAGVKSSRNTLYCSDFSKPWAWPSKFAREIEPGDGDFITGIASWRGVLFVFKTRHVYIVPGDLITGAYKVECIAKGTGLTNVSINAAGVKSRNDHYSGEACAVADNGVYWYDGATVMYYDGSRVIDIGIDVKTSFDSAVPSFDTARGLRFAILEYDGAGDALYLALADDDFHHSYASRNNKIWRCDRAGGGAGWTEYDGLEVNAMKAYGGDVYFADFYGRIYLLDEGRPGFDFGASMAGGTITASIAASSLIDTAAAFKTTGKREYGRVVWYELDSGVWEFGRVKEGSATSLELEYAPSGAVSPGQNYALGAFMTDTQTAWIKLEARKEINVLDVNVEFI